MLPYSENSWLGMLLNVAIFNAGSIPQITYPTEKKTIGLKANGEFREESLVVTDFSTRLMRQKIGRFGSGPSEPSRGDFLLCLT
jgi:hypothetical protein